MNCQTFSWPLSSESAWRQQQERDIARDLESLGAMPAGLIEEDDRMRARSDLGCDFVKMQLHGLAVAGRQHEGSAGPAFGTYGTEQIGGLGALIVNGAGS